MFKFKLKKEQNSKDDQIIKQNAVEEKEQVERDYAESEQVTSLEQIKIADSSKEQTDKESAQKEKNQEEKAQEKAILNDLSVFANLLSSSVQNLKEEFYLLQIRKIMSKIQKTIVRYDVTEEGLDKIFYQAGRYGLGGVVVAPVYLPVCIKQNKKNNLDKLKITSIIDFPFGENLLKSKITDVKENVKIGANSVAVTLPSMMLAKENLKTLKKACGKIYRSSKKNAGIVLNASDMTEENFIEATKVLRKTKISYIVLAFGEATIEEVKNKLLAITKNGLAKKLCVLANVDRVETATELFKLNVDSILTPYADDIGLDLLKRFNLIAN